MKDKIRILVTHQIHYLTQSNKIVLLEDGKIKAKGSYEDIIKSGIDMNQMFNEIENELETKRKNSFSPEKSFTTSIMSSPERIPEQTVPENNEENEVQNMSGSVRNVDITAIDQCGSV